MAAKGDMTQATSKQRARARQMEKDLKANGVPPREAETQVWENVNDLPGRGKRRKGRTQGTRGKIKSSAAPVNRKTRAVKSK